MIFRNTWASFLICLGSQVKQSSLFQTMFPIKPRRSDILIDIALTNLDILMLNPR